MPPLERPSCLAAMNGQARACVPGRRTSDAGSEVIDRHAYSQNSQLPIPVCGLLLQLRARPFLLQLMLHVLELALRLQHAHSGVKSWASPARAPHSARITSSRASVCALSFSRYSCSTRDAWSLPGDSAPPDAPVVSSSRSMRASGARSRSRQSHPVGHSVKGAAAQARRRQREQGQRCAVQGGSQGGGAELQVGDRAEATR